MVYLFEILFTVTPRRFGGLRWWLLARRCAAMRRKMG